VRRLTDAAFVHGELAIDPRYEVEQVPSAVALVEAGLGVTALPSLTFAMFKNRDLVTRPLRGPIVRRHVGFITRSQRTSPEFVADLKRAIRKQIEQRLQQK
jgi:LysR family carnitine catabolism transcriptional activator